MWFCCFVCVGFVGFVCFASLLFWWTVVSFCVLMWFDEVLFRWFCLWFIMIFCNMCDIVVFFVFLLVLLALCVLRRCYFGGQLYRFVYWCGLTRCCFAGFACDLSWFFVIFVIMLFCVFLLVLLALFVFVSLLFWWTVVSFRVLMWFNEVFCAGFSYDLLCFYLFIKMLTLFVFYFFWACPKKHTYTEVLRRPTTIAYDKLCRKH